MDESKELDVILSELLGEDALSLRPSQKRNNEWTTDNSYGCEWSQNNRNVDIIDNGNTKSLTETITNYSEPDPHTKSETTTTKKMSYTVFGNENEDYPRNRPISPQSISVESRARELPSTEHQTRVLEYTSEGHNRMNGDDSLSWLQQQQGKLRARREGLQQQYTDRRIQQERYLVEELKNAQFKTHVHDKEANIVNGGPRYVRAMSLDPEESHQTYTSKKEVYVNQQPIKYTVTISPPNEAPISPTVPVRTSSHDVMKSKSTTEWETHGRKLGRQRSDISHNRSTIPKRHAELSQSPVNQEYQTRLYNTYHTTYHVDQKEPKQPPVVPVIEPEVQKTIVDPKLDLQQSLNNLEQKLNAAPKVDVVDTIPGQFNTWQTSSSYQYQKPPAHPRMPEFDERIALRPIGAGVQQIEPDRPLSRPGTPVQLQTVSPALNPSGGGTQQRRQFKQTQQYYTNTQKPVEAEKFTMYPISMNELGTPQQKYVQEIHSSSHGGQYSPGVPLDLTPHKEGHSMKFPVDHAANTGNTGQQYQHYHKESQHNYTTVGGGSNMTNGASTLPFPSSHNHGLLQVDTTHPHVYENQAHHPSGAMTMSAGSNYNYQTSRRGSFSSVGGSGSDTFEVMHHTPKFVRDTSKFWYKPNISRDDAINILKDKKAGTFVVRDSNSFPGAFGLAVKVNQLPSHVQIKDLKGDSQLELVRHFLIEPTAKGVKLKGCSNEPVFGSLAALVYQHSITPLALPCKLSLPGTDQVDLQLDSQTGEVPSTAMQLLSQGAACNVLYLGSIDVESLTGPQAIGRSTTAILNAVPPPLTTVVHFKVSSQGITLTDNNRTLFFRRHYPVTVVTFCGMDPENRTWIGRMDNASHPFVNSRVFGFIARKNHSNADNSCHLFAENEPDQPASAIVNFVTKVMLGNK